MNGNSGSGAEVDLKDLTLVYREGDDPAVNRVSLTIGAGEFLTLLGPSGSGKTSTLNLIAGFLRPTVGTIRVDGADVSATPPHKRDFGMVFQNYALFPHMTVRENIAFPLKERKWKASDIDTAVDQVLRLVDLVGYDGRRPRELSGGQQQRVALARAVVFSPRVLLLDEPLGALDRKLRQTLQRQIKALHDELGLTFVFVTHDQDEAMALSDRIAVFNHGKIEAVGTPSELYEAPGTQFVAEFVGESNLFAGRPEGEGYVWQGNSWRLDSGDRPVDQTMLLVRPDRMLLFASEAEVPADLNRVEASIADRSYFGAFQRVGLVYSDGSLGSAVLPGNRRSPDVGQKVVVAWRPEDQALIRPSSPGSGVNGTTDEHHHTAGQAKAPR